MDVATRLFYANTSLSSTLAGSGETSQSGSILEHLQKQAKEALQEITGEGETQRETYGLKVMETMSDQEYQAFIRATGSMDDLGKTRAAQALHMMTSTYESSRQVMSGGLAATLNGTATSATELMEASAGLTSMIDEGITLFKQMSGGTQKDLNSFLQRYSYALKSEAAVDLQG